MFNFFCKNTTWCLTLLLSLTHLPWALKAAPTHPNQLRFYQANHANFRYTGRIDFKNPELPRFYAPGVYISMSFFGTACEIMINDELKYGKNHNYVSIVVDDLPAKRIKLTKTKNVIKWNENLKNTKHVLTICKSTEAGIGYLEFEGIRCIELLPLPPAPLRKIEFIGNSITCGTGSDLTIPCNSTSDWYDQHNAYLAYGPTAARALNSDWMLTSVSGIGMNHSCCNMKTTMPDVFDYISLSADGKKWDFLKYQPDLVSISLGQNDGKTDSLKFHQTYIRFLKRIRKIYPKATILCITSPMADPDLTAYLKRSLHAIHQEMVDEGENNTYTYFFKQRYNQGCGDHPNLAEHQQIADELIACIKKIKNW